MSIRTYRPMTPSKRYEATVDYSILTQVRPLRGLVGPLKRTGGRSNAGRISSRFIGGRHKRLYRVVDFRRDKRDIPARVEAIEYDPNRTAFLARLLYRDGERRYIIAPQGIRQGDEVISADEADICPGNHLPLRNVPVGSSLHNLELYPGRGGQLVRSAGSMAQLLAKEARQGQVRLPSGEVRIVSLDCRGTIGQVSNVDHENIVLGKAGRARWLGRLPHVRGVAMNPVDHPHGGGQGKSKGGNHPTSPTGVLAKGFKTRQNKRTDRYIVKDRRSRL